MSVLGVMYGFPPYFKLINSFPAIILGMIRSIVTFLIDNLYGRQSESVYLLGGMYGIACPAQMA